MEPFAQCEGLGFSGPQAVPLINRANSAGGRSDLRGRPTNEVRISANDFLAHRRRQEKQHFSRAEERNPLSALVAVEVNVTELCNRTCVFCPRAHGYPNQNLHMKPEDADKIALDLGNSGFQGRISFSGFGEAILNKQFFSIISAFRFRLPRNDIETNTNGDRLDVQTIQRLFAAGLSNIYVNLYDGPEQEEKFRGMFEEAGESRYILRPHWQGKEEDWGLKLTNRAGSIKTINLVELNKPLNRPCFYPFYKMFIDWNGDCLICCNDWNREKKLGNVFKTPISEIWDSEEMRSLREDLIVGDRSNKPCNKCDADGMLHGRESVKVFEKIYGWTDQPKGVR